MMYKVWFLFFKNLWFSREVSRFFFIFIFCIKFLGGFIFYIVKDEKLIGLFGNLWWKRE